MNSPYRVHPALPSTPEKTGAFPAMAANGAQPAPASRLQQLVTLEGNIRTLPTWAAVVFHALNETQELLGHGQGFFFRANRRNGFACEAASAVAHIDLRAPYLQALNGLANSLADANLVQTLDLQAAFKSRAIALRHGLWLPLRDGKGNIFAALLLTAEVPWNADRRMIAERLAGAYAHALRVQRPPQLLRLLSLPRWALWTVPATLLALAFVPVPLTTLAPFEIVARAPFPVTMPLDGVVAAIHVDPGQMVRVGQLLVTLEQTQLAAEHAVAEQRASVAAMKLATSRNGAFQDLDMKRNVTVLTRELEVAEAEVALAKGRLERAQVHAAADGLLVYATRSDWLGRPVRVGEKVMEIANRADVAVRVDVSVHDAVALQDAEHMRLFLDADPLRPLRADVTEKSFHAEERVAGVLSYTVRGALKVDDGSLPRIGLRGTAQLIGQKVPLGFFLLRRPLAALRQYFGI